MITSINLFKPIATKIINELTQDAYWRFTKLTDNDMTMRYNFYDEYGFEYNRDVYIRASKDNRKLIVYVNKKDFPAFARDEYLDEDIIDLLKSYLIGYI